MNDGFSFPTSIEEDQQNEIEIWKQVKQTTDADWELMMMIGLLKWNGSDRKKNKGSKMPFNT